MACKQKRFQHLLYFLYGALDHRHDWLLNPFPRGVSRAAKDAHDQAAAGRTHDPPLARSLSLASISFPAPFNMVQARLKGSSMHWQRGHLNPMLALRMAVCNDRWQQMWHQAVRQQCVVQALFASPGGLFDRTAGQWTVMDVDSMRCVARQRALPQVESLPAPHRRFDQVCAPGYQGRKDTSPQGNRIFMRRG